MSAHARTGRAGLAARLTGLAGAVASARVLMGLPAAAAQAATPAPAVFQVGAAAVNIDPHVPVCMGGYGCGTPTDAMHTGEHLYARAIFIRHGNQALAFAKVDSQGYFAGYQEGPYGITDIRQQIASEWRSAGLDVGQQNIIVSSTHDHAAPTIMGIWGPTSAAYLKEVHDGVVAALRQARAAARAATLTWGEADASFIDNEVLGEANSNEGWPVDGSMPVLWARDAHTGATIATYVNVPVHANIVYGPGDGGVLSAEYPGVAEQYLESHLGGTALVAMGTLGDQTSTLQVSMPGWTEIAHVGTLVGNLAAEALGHGHPVTSTRLSAGEQYVTLPVTNPVLLSLIDAKGQFGSAIAGATPADRSDRSPYWQANDVVGTWVTSFGIGDIAYVTEPGEAFPQIHAAIESGIANAQRVFVVGMAQDQLGYFFPSWAYPFTFYYSVDHYLYNVSPVMADQVVTGARQALAAAGFANTPLSPLLPGAYDYAATANPGVQAMAFPRSGAAPFTSQVQCYVDPARLQNDLDHPGNGIPDMNNFNTQTGPCSLGFGDGTPATTDGAYHYGGSSHNVAGVAHTWTRPGTYTITTQVADGAGRTATWSIPVYVSAPLSASVIAPRPAHRRSSRSAPRLLHVAVGGGDGVLLAARWTLSDGSQVWGAKLAVLPGHPRPVSVTVTDGDGSQASTPVSA